MTDPRTLFLRLDEGRPVAVQFRREGTAISLRSGRELREVHGWIVTADVQLHEHLTRLLPTIGDYPVRAEDEAGEFAGKWAVSWNSYAEAAGVHTYTLILREAEDLLLEALIIDGLELHPYEYREALVGDALTISAKVVGTEEDVLRLRELVRQRGDFAVVRRGIQDEPRAMRLGVAEWSEFEDRIKYRLVLMERGLDETLTSQLVRIEEENRFAALGFYMSFMERLAGRLVEKGVLEEEELGALREAARLEPGMNHHELWRVPDVDEL